MAVIKIADREVAEAIIASLLPELTPEEVAELLDRAEDYFLEQTGRSCIPKRATYLWADLAVAIQKDRLEATRAEITQQSGGAVSSIKRGDTTIQYTDGQSGVGSSSGNRLVSSMADRLKKYQVVRAR